MPLDPLTALLARWESDAAERRRRLAPIERAGILQQLARAPEATEQECREALWWAGLCVRCAQQRAAPGATLCPACATEGQ